MSDHLAAASGTFRLGGELPVVRPALELTDEFAALTEAA